MARCNYCGTSGSSTRKSLWRAWGLSAKQIFYKKCIFWRPSRYGRSTGLSLISSPVKKSLASSIWGNAQKLLNLYHNMNNPFFSLASWHANPDHCDSLMPFACVSAGTTALSRLGPSVFLRLKAPHTKSTPKSLHIESTFPNTTNGLSQIFALYTTTKSCLPL